MSHTKEFSLCQIILFLCRLHVTIRICVAWVTKHCPSKRAQFHKRIFHEMLTVFRLFPKMPTVSRIFPKMLTIIRIFPKMLTVLPASYGAHCHIFASPPLGSILSQLNLVHIHSVVFKSILILFSHLQISLHSDLFPSEFPTKISYTFLISFMRACKFVVYFLISSFNDIWHSPNYEFSHYVIFLRPSVSSIPKNVAFETSQTKIRVYYIDNFLCVLLKISKINMNLTLLKFHKYHNHSTDSDYNTVP
jgi:hypothetical protein